MHMLAICVAIPDIWISPRDTVHFDYKLAANGTPSSETYMYAQVARSGW
jgi:hypothetical protein